MPTRSAPRGSCSTAGGWPGSGARCAPTGVNSTAQANRQTVIQFKGRYAANVREDVKRVQTQLLLDLGRIAAGKDVS